MTENNLLEVLAPVGDMERLYAALDFGADAVYLGGTAFGMRAASARLMMKAQPPRSRILQCADDLIVNEDDEAALRKRLDALSRIWMAITR